MSNATQMVRSFAAAKGMVRKKETKLALGLSTDQVVYAFDTLKNQGYLRQVKHGLYQFADFVEKPGMEVNDKIWKAMKICPSFTVSDIARLADSTSSYVYKRFRQYRADGFIKQYGTRKTSPSSREKIWRLTQAGKGKAQNPNIETFTPDPLVMAVVNLNRLVCSGMAVRDHEAGKQALKFVQEIKNGLEDAGTS